MKFSTRHIYLLLLILTNFAFTSCKKDKVLIIGDSISIGYTPFVTKELKNKATVIHNPGNAQHSGNGLKKIKNWIGEEQWDVIQFNWGLWDLCYRDKNSKEQGNRDKIHGKITYNLEDYKANLEAIVLILKETTKAKLIFVTTSYVPEKEVGRYSNDPIKYNAVAKKLMNKHGILVNDIYEKSIPIHKKYGLGTDDVHYTKEGYQKLSELIVKVLQKEI